MCTTLNNESYHSHVMFRRIFLTGSRSIWHIVATRGSHHCLVLSHNHSGPQCGVHPVLGTYSMITLLFRIVCASKHFIRRSYVQLTDKHHHQSSSPRIVSSARLHSAVRCTATDHRARYHFYQLCRTSAVPPSTGLLLLDHIWWCHVALSERTRAFSPCIPPFPEAYTMPGHLW